MHSVYCQTSFINRMLRTICTEVERKRNYFYNKNRSLFDQQHLCRLGKVQQKITLNTSRLPRDNIVKKKKSHKNAG